MTTSLHPEHVLLILCISSMRVSATVALMHPQHGDKVIAHKVIECSWHTLSWATRSQAVAEVIQLAADSAGVEPYSVFVSMSDSSVNSQMTIGEAFLGEELVLTDQEQSWALRRAQDAITSSDELVEAIPVQWTIRDNHGKRDVDDPCGQRGQRLTCKVLNVTARVGYLAEIKRLTEPLGIEIEDIVLQPLALYRGIASTVRKKGDLVVIDCGARCTTILVSREHLCHVQAYAFGGDELTQAIADQLAIPFTQAETLKAELDLGIHHGGAGIVQEGQQFIWSEIRERHRLTGPASTLIGDLLKRFFRERFQELRDAGLLGSHSHIHLFGRTCLLSGLSAMVHDITGLPVQLGTGSRHRDPSTEMADALILGLVRSASDRRRRHLSENPRKFRKTVSGVWAWLGHPIT